MGMPIQETEKALKAQIEQLKGIEEQLQTNLPMVIQRVLIDVETKVTSDFVKGFEGVDQLFGGKFDNVSENFRVLTECLNEQLLILHEIKNEIRKFADPKSIPWLNSSIQSYSHQ
jgi:hypothetical protein